MAPSTTSTRNPKDSTDGADERLSMESELSSPALVTPPPRHRNAAPQQRASKSKSILHPIGEEETKQGETDAPAAGTDDLNADARPKALKTQGMDKTSSPSISSAKKDVDTLMGEIYEAQGDAGVQLKVKKRVNSLVLKMDGGSVRQELISYVHKSYEAVTQFCNLQSMGDIKTTKPRYHEKDVMGQIGAWTLPADVSEASSTSYATFTQLIVILLSSLTQLGHAESYVDFYRRPSKVSSITFAECQRVLNGVCSRLVTVWTPQDKYSSILKAYATRLTSASGAREVEASSRLHVLSAVLRSHGQANVSEAITLSDAMTFLAGFLHSDSTLLAIRDDHLPKLMAHLTIVYNSLGAKACEMMARAHFGTNAQALPSGNHIIDSYRDSCLTGSEVASDAFDLEAFGKELKSVLSRAARLNTVPKKGQVNTATAEDAFFSAEEKRSAEMHAMITKLAAFFVDEKSSSHKHGATAHGADRSHGHGTTKSGAGWPRPGATTRSHNSSNERKRYPAPAGFPPGICYKYCIGMCHRKDCNRKHEKTTEAMQIIRDAATTQEN